MTAMLTLDCARCGAKQMTHNVVACTTFSGTPGFRDYEYSCQCRACWKCSIYMVKAAFGDRQPDALFKREYAIDYLVESAELARPRVAAREAPEHTPPNLKQMFDEGSDCLTIGAWNASSAMFRKILDHISKEKMNAAPGGPPSDFKTQFNLKPRLKWLFDNGHLPKELAELADAIREDANDGVHNDPIGEAEALDIQDFAVEVLENLYTIPGRLADAKTRRNARRTPKP
jgi:hypothetical protein